MRRARTLFGEDRKVNDLIEELEKEIANIKSTNEKGKKLEFLFYFSMAILLYFLFFIVPNNQFFDSEKKHVKETLDLIDRGELELATSKANALKHGEAKVDLLSKIQLEKHLEFFMELEEKWPKLSLEEKKVQLGKAIWKKNSLNYDEKKIEGNYFEVFVARKSALNHQLPEKERLKFSIIL